MGVFLARYGAKCVRIRFVVRNRFALLFRVGCICVVLSFLVAWTQSYGLSFTCTIFELGRRVQLFVLHWDDAFILHYSSLALNICGQQ